MTERQAERLNAQLDNQTLNAEWFLAGQAPSETLAEWRSTRPHLFSQSRIWIDAADVAAIREGVEALHACLQTPAYQVLAETDGQHGLTLTSPGVLFGYDFHLTPTGPKLIEINTNAGGAFLSACLGEAWRVRESENLLAPRGADLVDMFQTEWLRFQAPLGVQPAASPPGWVLIVDEAPAEQYLYPEFVLCQQALSRLGWKLGIAAPTELVWSDGRLCFQGEVVSVVYNRLTDFSLSEPDSAALSAAYDAGAVLVTPSPAHHAVFAEKSHLVRLQSPGMAQVSEVSSTQWAAILPLLLKAVRVTPDAAEALWAQRKQYFFKPLAGFGSKAAYRGDKLTRRVFESILQGAYVAQELALPPERSIQMAAAAGPESQTLKFDVRAYVYEGRVLGLMARLYQGQTTNFRTPGGGFAPVYCAPSP